MISCSCAFYGVPENERFGEPLTKERRHESDNSWLPEIFEMLLEVNLKKEMTI